MSNKIRSAYQKRTRVPTHFEEGSQTQQCFKNECDINRILDKYQKTGLVTHLSDHSGAYGDYSGDLDYQTSLNFVMSAQQAFNDLPSSIRRRFENDPGKFLDFVENPENSEALIEMGLATPKAENLNPGKDSNVSEPAQPNDTPAADT